MSDKLPQTVDKGDMVAELNTFKDDYEAFSYYSVRAKDEEGFIRHFDGITKGKGKETLVALGNNNLDFRFRGKAKQMLKDKAKNQERINKGETLLISVEEAMAYEPGSRDSLSEQSLLRKRSEAFENAKEAKAAGDMEAYKAFALEAVAFNKQLEELNAAQMQEIADVIAG